jgi:hypothetical protein
MKIICKSSNRFLIKGEWYEVLRINDVDNGTGDRTINYEIDNHTDKVWNSSWFGSVNFHTLQELRDQKLNELGI